MQIRRSDFVKTALQNFNIVLVYPMFSRVTDICKRRDNVTQDAELMGHFVISKCGHDAGECYVVVSAAGNDLCIANGKNRSIQNPKKKNRAHLFITRQAVPDISLLLHGEPVSSNLKLAGFIENYKKHA